MMTTSKLENMLGDLRDAYRQAEPGTVLHVDQLMNERRLHPITKQGEDLRRLLFYTADGIIYRLNEKGIPELVITREPENLVLRHLNDQTNNSFDQLLWNYNYSADPAEVQQAMSAESTVIIDLTKLRLRGRELEYNLVEVSTTKYDKLNSEKRKLAERVYGQGADFTANMKMLKDAGISETRIFVLNPEYVRREAVQDPLGRASWVLSFDHDSYFNADVRCINYDSGVRGVRKK